MTTHRAVDSSFDPLTQEEATCLKRSNTLFVQCLWTALVQPDPRVINLREAHNAELDIAGYISLNGRGTGTAHVKAGLAGLPDDLRDALKFVAVDVELPGIPARQIWEAIRELERQSLNPIIYTSYNAWTTMVIPRNPTGFSAQGYKLWNAFWDKHPDVDFPRYRFGGWSDDQVVMEQYSGGTSVCEQLVDRNVIVDLGNLYGETSELPIIDPPEAYVFDGVLDTIVTFEGYAPTTLGAALRRGLVAFDAVQGVEAAVKELQAFAIKHLQVHNSSGGTLDRYSAEFLEKVAEALNDIETIFRNEVTRE